MDVLVAARFDDRGEALFGDAHESVGVGCGMHGIDRDRDAKKNQSGTRRGARERGRLTFRLCRS